MNRPAIPVSARATVVLGLASLAGLVAFCWPLFVAPEPSMTGQAPTAPMVFMLILPIVVAVVLTELAAGRMDAKVLAMLGVLSAVNAVLRPLGAGTAGIELVFFLLVLAGRVFGPGFGFTLGTISLFASALLTAGVGPWLPFQMLASAWIGLGAGLLPRRLRGRAELMLLAGYAAVASYLYGALMNLSFWPYALGPDTPLSYLPGAPVTENLHRFLLFNLATSALGWDTVRAIVTAVATLLVGPLVLTTLRRAARRASFDPPVRFAPSGVAGSRPVGLLPATPDPRSVEPGATSGHPPTSQPEGGHQHHGHDHPDRSAGID